MSLISPTFAYNPIIWLGSGVTIAFMLHHHHLGFLAKVGYILTAITGGALAHGIGIELTSQSPNNTSWLFTVSILSFLEGLQVFASYIIIQKYQFRVKELLTFHDVFGTFVIGLLIPSLMIMTLKVVTVSTSWSVFKSGVITTDFFSWFVADSLSVFVSFVVTTTLLNRHHYLWRKRIVEVCIPITITYFFVTVLAVLTCPAEMDLITLFSLDSLAPQGNAVGCRVAGSGMAFNVFIMAVMFFVSSRSFLVETRIRMDADEVKKVNDDLKKILASSWFINKTMNEANITKLAAYAAFSITDVRYIVIGVNGHDGAYFYGYLRDDFDLYISDAFESSHVKNVIADKSIQPVKESLHNADGFYELISNSVNISEMHENTIDMFTEKNKGFLSFYSPANAKIGINDATLLNMVTSHVSVAMTNLSTILKERETSHRLMQSDAIINTASEGVFIVDKRLQVTQVNPAFQLITGYSPSEVKGRHIFRLGLYKIRLAEATRIKLSILENGAWSGELDCLHREGQIVNIKLTVKRVIGDDNTVYYAGVFSDITSFKNNALMLQKQADHDDLTGLANRKFFNRALEEALNEAASTRTRCGVLYIDLDKFKQVNDTMGHQSGDILLKKVAKRIRTCTRENDLIARLGGDEFAVILRKVKKVEAIERVAQAILDEMNRPFELAGKEAAISCSIGMSIYPEHGEDLTSLLRYADNAMYETKRDGRNGFKFYSHEMGEIADKKYDLEKGIKEALNSDGFELYYQPLVGMKDDSLLGFEALIRWVHPDRGFMSPLDFLGVAEETGLMEQIDDWVLNCGFAQMREWINLSIAPPILALNISGHQMYSMAIVDRLAELVKKYEIDPTRIELEISENFVMKKASEVIDILNNIKAMGFKLSIDDFGTGYSSLSYLKRMPIDTLKIDSSFVRDIVEDEDDRMIVNTMVTLAHNLNMKVIAEGVETQEQRDFLISHGADYLQGYLYSRPLNKKDTLTLLNTHPTTTANN